MLLPLESSLPFPSDSPTAWELWEEEKVQETRSVSLPEAADWEGGRKLNMHRAQGSSPGIGVALPSVRTRQGLISETSQ